MELYYKNLKLILVHPGGLFVNEYNLYNILNLL
nr:MAG TPA: hypothetical protein [Caudoviricetes sp.]